MITRDPDRHFRSFRRTLDDIVLFRGGAHRVRGACILLRMTDNGLSAFYRRYNACCNEHRFDDLREFVARDVMVNGTDRGLDAYVAGLRAVVRAFPDYRWELRHLLVNPPWIAAHFADTGTHQGAFLGVPATGRSVSTQEFAFYRVDGGLIAEVWVTADDLHLLQQLRYGGDGS